MFDPPGEAVLRSHRGDHRIDLAPRGPAITVWRGERYPATLTSAIVGDQLSRLASASNSSSATAPCPASRDISRDRVAITFSPSAGLSAPATTAAVTSPIECPITASGSTP